MIMRPLLIILIFLTENMPDYFIEGYYWRDSFSGFSDLLTVRKNALFQKVTL